MIKIINPNKDIFFYVNAKDDKGKDIILEQVPKVKFYIYTDSRYDNNKIELDMSRYKDGFLSVKADELKTLSSGDVKIAIELTYPSQYFNDDNTFDTELISYPGAYLDNNPVVSSSQTTEDKNYTKYQAMYNDLNNKVDSNEDKIVEVNTLASNLQASIDKVNEKNNEQDSSIGQNRVDINTNKDNITNTKADLSDYTLYKEFDSAREALSKINNVE